LVSFNVWKTVLKNICVAAMKFIRRKTLSQYICRKKIFR